MAGGQRSWTGRKLQPVTADFILILLYHVYGKRSKKVSVKNMVFVSCGGII